MACNFIVEVTSDGQIAHRSYPFAYVFSTFVVLSLLDFRERVSEAVWLCEDVNHNLDAGDAPVRNHHIQTEGWERYCGMLKRVVS